MTSREGKRRRVLTYDERVLWTTVTRSVAPMHGDAPAQDEDAGEVPSAPERGAPLPVRVPPPSPVVPLDRRMRQRVARGRAAIDARMDLHGLTQADAHAALSRFLRAASARGARLVLVVTGKGGRSGAGGERGVLRRQVPQWLSLPEFRDLVVGFEDAHVAHGGEGALYVRLRRRRGEPD
jgi:DNA-nicking Smr family endonuclease